MSEMIIVALLIWLWVIERRLNGLLKSVDALNLDIQGLRMEPANSRSESQQTGTAISPVQQSTATDTASLPNRRNGANRLRF